MVGNDELPLAQELVGDADALAEQAAGVLPEVENQAFEIAHFVERVCHFMLGGLIETGDVHVADAGADHEVQIHAVARNLVAHHGEFERLVGSLAQHRDVDGSPFRPFEQVGRGDGHFSLPARCDA